MNFIINSSKRVIASQLLSSSSTNSPHKTLISLLYYNQYSTSTTATASGWKKKNQQQQKQNPKKTPKSSQLEEEEQLPSYPSSLLQKKPSLVDWPRPSEIPWQAKVANSVNLVGRLDSPVKFVAAPDGKYWAATTLVQPDSLRIRVLFEGDLAHIAACHLKERDLVHIDGQLSADSPPFALGCGQSTFQVMVHNVNFVEVALPLKKSFSNHKISVHLENAKDNTYVQKLSQDDDYQSKESAEDDTYPKQESVEDNLVDNSLIDHKVEAKSMKADAKSGDLTLDSWKDLLKNPTQWRDHRENKLKGLVKPKYPDFKHKDSGVGIWLNSAPKWVLPELVRVKFDTPPQKSKKADDDSWKDLVENPKKWWDNRSNKVNKKSPDFKHKDSGKALWLSDSPSWAVSKLPPLKAQAN